MTASGTLKSNTTICFIFVVFERYNVRFEIIIAVGVDIMMFWDVNQIYTIEMEATGFCVTSLVHLPEYMMSHP